MNKRVVGLSDTHLTLEDGYWWALAKPFLGDKLEVCGRFIHSIRVIDGRLELAIDEHKLYLDWLDSNGKCVGPRFPVPGMIRCWDHNEDNEWKEIDSALDIIEKALNGTKEQ